MPSRNITYMRNKFIYFLVLLIGCILWLSIPFSVLQAPTIIHPVLFPIENAARALNAIEPLVQKIDRTASYLSSLKADYQKSKPGKPYLVVNTSGNEVRLINGRKILQTGKCSTGSYILLKTKGDRQWLFRTPRGEFRVTVKLKDPWWYKPDWAYLEENVPIPSIYSRDRYQGGVLGDFALGFGQGYLVHGTLYKRFLGMPVTHGCVRLDDEEMAFVFKTLTHGSKIYIY